MKILGLSCYYHDSAAALVIDGQVITAAQEERFTRKKQDPGFPLQAARFCLASQGLKIEDLDEIVFYEKPLLKFERLLQTYLAFAPRGFPSFRKALPIWVREKLFQRRNLEEAILEVDDSSPRNEILFSEHHLSHAASAFYPSPFQQAAVLTMDGVGEWATTATFDGDGVSLRPLKEIRFPHSLGLLYSAFTAYTGFKVNSGEYKLMGLAPYGKPRFAQAIFENLIDLKADGSFRLNMDYFDYCTGLTMTNSKFDSLFGGPGRKPESPLSQREMDLAASIQAVCEEVVLRLAKSLRQDSGRKNLCLAGGVALNCVANGRLWREGLFENIWVQPAAGDAGGALGAALFVAHLKGAKRQLRPDRDGMRGSFLGPAFTSAETESRLRAMGAVLQTFSFDQLKVKTARLLADGQAVGWARGAMEFGPRALGARSILADPRPAEMQKNLNLKIKFRESFRPFAPAVLADRVQECFEFKGSSDYMQMVANAKIKIPAVTHVDSSARIQTVQRETNPDFYDLISEFDRLTGVPVLVNTSFNIRGEPIVNTPEDAYRCLMGTDLDALVFENCLLLKTDQPEHLKADYRHRHELD